MRIRFLTIVFCCVTASAWAAGPDVDTMLTTGQFSEGIASLEAHLQDQPKDDTARFGLGTLRLVRAIEQLGQKLTAFGPRTYGNEDLQKVFGDVAAPAEMLTYPRLRKILQEWLDELARVETILARIESSDVKLSLHVGRIPLKFGGEGAESVNLLPLLRESRITPKGKEADFVISFDRADVDWLRGYCHLLAAFGEIALAYDGQEFFDVIAHRVFKHVKVHFDFLSEEGQAELGEGVQERFIIGFFADLIAAIHVIRFPVVEPKRMAAALAHIESTVSLSRQMWKHVLTESDDDHEWIPGPKQTGVLGVSVTQDMIDHWMVALDETDKILQGKRLLPFWRGTKPRGLNLRRAFLEPGRLDLILWLHGTAAAPYLEEGEITPSDTWMKINEAFRGEFPGFALWFN